MAALDHHELTAFDLGHDAGEGVVNKRVEGGVADNVMGDVDSETLMRGDRRCDGVKNIGECREGS